jgi:hypothetical protein
LAARAANKPPVSDGAPCRSARRFCRKRDDREIAIAVNCLRAAADRIDLEWFEIADIAGFYKRATSASFLRKRSCVGALKSGADPPFPSDPH